MWKPSLVYSMDSDLPQAGLAVSLRWVICFRCLADRPRPRADVSKDWRIRATLPVLRDRDAHDVQRRQ